MSQVPRPIHRVAGEEQTGKVVMSFSPPRAKLFLMFLKTIQKIGETMFLCTDKAGLVIRTLNSSQISFVNATFRDFYFSNFEGFGACQCPLTIKPCIAALRSFAASSTSSDGYALDLLLDGSQPYASIIVKQRAASVCKTFEIPLDNADSVTVVAPSDMKFSVTGSSKLFSDIFTSLPPDLEATISIGSSELKVASSTIPDLDAMGSNAMDSIVIDSSMFQS
jgi:hypothetical protein